MWKYLAWNLKADVNMFSPIKLVSLRNRKPYRDLSNQNGMDFVTELSFCKTPVADIWKNVDFSNRRESQLGKSFII